MAVEFIHNTEKMVVKKIDAKNQFPVKLTLFALIMTLSLFGLVFYQIWNSKQEMSKIYREQFPSLLDIASLLRIGDSLNKDLEIDILKKNSSQIGDREQALNVLVDSIAQLNILPSQSGKFKVDAENIVLQVQEEFRQLQIEIQNKNWVKAQSRYQGSWDEATANLHQKLSSYAEELALENEQRLAETSLQMKLGIALVSFVFLLLLSIWALTYVLFRRNLLQRQEAEHALEEQRLISNHTSKLASMGEIAGGIAHEINNPLFIILGTCYNLRSLLKANPQLDSESIVPFVKKINETADRIAKIVAALRSLSREGSRDPFVNVAADRVIDNILALSKERFKEKDIKLTVESELTEGLFCRQAQIEQILLNLVNNAFDAVENHPQAWVRLELKRSADWIEFRVLDSGNGIDKEIATKIMNPFFTTKDVGRGTGLGLSISLRLARDHGGDLRYDATSKNTCFVLTLPAKKGDSSTENDSVENTSSPAASVAKAA